MIKRAKKLSIVGAVILSLGGCASSKPSKRPDELPFYRLYVGSFDTVWNSTVRVLDIYSITIANREGGQLKTEWSDFRHNRELYDHPEQNDSLEEVKYRLKIKLSKAFVTQTGEPAVRVQVVKELTEYKNIQTDWVRVPTDHFEENVLLYRIGQRLRISEILKRKSTATQKSAARNTAPLAPPSIPPPEDAPPAAPATIPEPEDYPD